jgi:hypothetical protein
MEMEDYRKWLAEFLNYAPYIDPYDDEAFVVNDMMPYVKIIHAAHTRIVDKLKKENDDMWHKLNPERMGR